jgi:hypothetical protein
LQPYFDSCDNKIDFEGLKNGLVLVHRNNYYVFGDGSYHFSTQTSLYATVRRHLLYRAEGLDFDYFYTREADGPPTPKTPDHFVRDHCEVIHKVVYTHQGVSRFDREEATLYLSECSSPKRIKPEHRDDVDCWMRAICGNDAAQLTNFRAWLSQAPNVSLPLAALVLSGPTGIGKSSFAEGVARIWGTSPGSMRNAVSTHNSQVVFSPVVLADESLPRVDGKVPTDFLRSLISSNTHEVNNKNIPIAQLHSHLRVIVAIQDPSKFDFGHGHSKNDNVAIAKRFVFIDGNAQAADLFDYDKFVRGGAIASHAMHLAETLPRTSTRFGVESNGTKNVLFAHPTALRVVDVILDALRERVHKAGDPTATVPAVFVSRAGEVLVNTDRLLANWTQYAGLRDVPPSRQRAVTALRALSSHEDSVRVEFETGTPSYWCIRPDVLRSRALFVEHFSETEFDLVLKIPHELAFRRKQGGYQLTDDDRKRRSDNLRAYLSWLGKHS